MEMIEQSDQLLNIYGLFYLRQNYFHSYIDQDAVFTRLKKRNKKKRIFFLKQLKTYFLLLTLFLWTFCNIFLLQVLAFTISFL